MRSEKSYRGAKVVWTLSITMLSMVGLELCAALGDEKVFFLSRFLSGKARLLLRHLMKMVLKSLDWGRFVVVHPCSALFLHCELMPSENVEVENSQTSGFNPKGVTG